MPVEDERDALVTVTVHGPSTRGGRVVARLARSAEHVGALLAGMLAELGLDSADYPAARAVWILATERGEWFTEAPFRSEVRVGSIVAGSSAIELYLDESPVCRHGSPGVRGHGHLCGWC
jgi:hypothetical protein